jgi:hypothetical protein
MISFVCKLSFQAFDKILQVFYGLSGLSNSERSPKFFRLLVVLYKGLAEIGDLIL